MSNFTARLGVIGLTLLAASWGCDSSPSKSRPINPSESSLVSADRWMTNQPFEDQANNAIQVRRTIQPSRFDIGTANLNRLGIRDVRVLATRYESNPGLLSIARGDADDALYTSRVKAVMDELAANGVDVNRMTIDESPPGGPGMASVNLIQIVEIGRTENLRPERGQLLGQLGGSEPVE